MLAIGAVIELMVVFYAVVLDAQPYLVEFSLFHNLPLTMCLDKDTLLAKADTSEQFARTEQACIAIARGRYQRGALTLIANDFLCEHVPRQLQTIGGHGLQREPALAIREVPMGIDGVVVPRPDGK